MSHSYGPHTQHVSRTESDFDARLRKGLDGKHPAHNPAFDNMSSEKLKALFNNAAMGNEERQADAIRKSDSFAFQVAHPEYVRSANNERLINHQLETLGITNPTFPDFQRVYDDLRASNLIEINKNAPEPVFKGMLTGRTFENLDQMILQERQFALEHAPRPTEEEIAFENLSADQVRELTKRIEREDRQKNNAPTTTLNADAWLTFHSEFEDSPQNAKLVLHQLATNGVLEDAATVEDYETVSRQLRAPGLLKLKKSELAKQHQEQVRKRAADALAEPGSIFDNTTVEQMNAMPMDELKRRSNIVLGK